MRRAVAFSFVLALCTAAPASAQLWFFPNVPVPTGGADMSGAFIGIDVARGLNDASGQVNALGGSLGFMGAKAGLRVGGAVLDNDSDEKEVTAGAAVAFDLLDSGSSGQISLQGGVGWLDEEVLGETVTLLRFPIGVALKMKIVDNADSRSNLWVMPRIDIVRVSVDGGSDSDSEFGASAGLSTQRRNGFGFYTAIDVLFPEEADENPILLSGGLSYRFGG